MVMVGEAIKDGAKITRKKLKKSGNKMVKNCRNGAKNILKSIMKNV